VWRRLSTDITTWARGCHDLVGLLQYSNNFNHIFTIIDRTSKWMEAIPLSDTSMAACAKALTFSWISRFGVPETITSDYGPQFISNLWFKLSEMLHISHKQTTAYHPESNGEVKRLHRRLIVCSPQHSITWPPAPVS
jgi:cleavage and polyadenylation specificity factor subunit 1